MSDQSAEPASPEPTTELPAPASCARNLHRASELRGSPPEATDLCVNAAGAFHMLDCPLTWGRPCALYEKADDPHPCAGETEIVKARAQLHRDFLRWPYAQRLKALSQGLDALPTRRAVESVPEPEEQIPESLLSVEPAEVEEEPSLPVEPTAERYPGQRRSEDRRKRPAPPPETDGAEDEDAPAEPAPPRTVDSVFEELPEAPDVELRPKRRRRRGGGRRGGRRGSTDGRTSEGGSADGGERSGKSPKRSRRRRKPPSGGPPSSS